MTTISRRAWCFVVHSAGSGVPLSSRVPSPGIGTWVIDVSCFAGGAVIVN